MLHASLIFTHTHTHVQIREGCEGSVMSAAVRLADNACSCTNLSQHIHELQPCQKKMSMSVGMFSWSQTGPKSFYLNE